MESSDVELGRGLLELLRASQRRFDGGVGGTGQAGALTHALGTVCRLERRFEDLVTRVIRIERALELSLGTDECPTAIDSIRSSLVTLEEDYEKTRASLNDRVTDMEMDLGRLVEPS